MGRQRGRGFGALAQIIGRTAIPNLRKNIVPAAKRVGTDLLEFAVPEIAEVVGGRKNLKTAAKSVGRQALRKQLGEGPGSRRREPGGRERQRTAGWTGSRRKVGSRKKTTSRVIPTKSTKQSSR